MNRFENFILSLNNTLDSKRKRHIAGGILLSISLMLGGISFTVLTLKEDYENE